MNVSNLIDRLNAELDKLNKLKSNEIDTRNFFTENEHFNDNPDDYFKSLEENSKSNQEKQELIENNISLSDSKITVSNYQNITPNNDEKSVVIAKPNYLAVAQNMFKKTIKFSLKSFLISISLSFLNLFV